MKRFGLAVCLAVAVLSAGCKDPIEVWFGVEYTEDLTKIKLAAEEPRCGCVTLRNNADRVIVVQALLHDVVVGQQKLNAREAVRVKFDWAGHLATDVYLLAASEETGRPIVPIKDVLIYEALSPWDDCQVLDECPYGALLMNAGDLGQ